MAFFNNFLSDISKARQTWRQEHLTEQGWHFKERMMIGCLTAHARNKHLWKVQWKFQSISLVFHCAVLSTESFHVAQHELNYVEVANAKSQKGEFKILILQLRISVDTSHQEGHLFHLSSWHKYCSFMNKLPLEKWCSPQVEGRHCFYIFNN